MKKIHALVSSLSVAIAVAVGPSAAFAALTPSLIVSSVGGSSVQVIVNNADPDASAVLNYTSAASAYSSIGLGITNSSGYLSTTVNSSADSIQSNSPAWVTVDGVQSESVTWPNYSSSGGGALSLSQTVLNLGAGQGATVTASNPVGSLSITTDSNSSIAIASVYGDSIAVTAYDNPGNTTITVCDSSNDCQSIQVSVLSSAASAFTLSATALNLNVGQSQTVTLSGIGPFSVSGNSNASVASASINGDNLIIAGTSAGSTALSVCQGGSQCQTVNVYVNSNGVSSPSSASSLSFSQSSLTLAIGQNQSVGMYGSGSYYLTSDSNSGAVSASISGTNLVVAGLQLGTAAIGACSTTNQCGSIQVTVSPSGTAVSSAPLALASFSVSSGNQSNSLLSGGNSLVVNFTANQQVVNPSVRVAAQTMTPSGSGAGPYSATYLLSGSETMPIPIVISFSNTAGASASSYFWAGNSSSAPASTAATSVTAPVSVSTPNCPAGYTCAPAPASTVSAAAAPASSDYTYQFSNYLYMGMTPQGQSDPDVVALQERLLKDGDFSGPVSGYFGPLTQAAVEAYQSANGVSPLGVVGPATRQLLNQGI